MVKPKKLKEPCEDAIWAFLSKRLNVFAPSSFTTARKRVSASCFHLSVIMHGERRIGAGLLPSTQYRLPSMTYLSGGVGNSTRKEAMADDVPVRMRDQACPHSEGLNIFAPSSFTSPSVMAGCPYHCGFSSYKDSCEQLVLPAS